MSSKFYPLNFYLTRPDARACFKDMQAYGDDIGLINPPIAEKIVMDHVLPRLRDLGWTETSPEGGIAVMSQEVQGVLAWEDWAFKGREIVCIDESLVHAFENSDCGDIRILDVLPEHSTTLYLHFDGKLENPIDLGDGALLEGVYVVSSPSKSVRFVLCARQSDSKSPLSKWRERYDLRIPSEFLTIAADEAVDMALAEDLADLRSARLQTLKNPRTGALQAIDVLTKRMIEGHEAYRRALRLALNSLAYLKNYSDDSRKGWPEQAPERLVKQLNGATPKEANRAQSKLWSLGFVQVTYLGENFSETLRRNAPHGTVRAHWRRGHWRHQAYGPKLSLMKLIWLQPTLVGV